MVSRSLSRCSRVRSRSGAALSRARRRGRAQAERAVRRRLVPGEKSGRAPRRPQPSGSLPALWPRRSACPRQRRTRPRWSCAGVRSGRASARARAALARPPRPGRHPGDTGDVPDHRPPRRLGNFEFELAGFADVQALVAEITRLRARGRRRSGLTLRSSFQSTISSSIRCAASTPC